MKDPATLWHCDPELGLPRSFASAPGNVRSIAMNSASARKLGVALAIVAVGMTIVLLVAHRMYEQRRCGQGDPRACTAQGRASEVHAPVAFPQKLIRFLKNRG
jgi:hypothetical protein